MYTAFIDMDKCFDTINRNLLMFSRLLQYNTDCNMYKAVQNLYHYIESCIKINHMLSDGFIVGNGIRQGDNLSPTLFSLFLNELAKEIKAMNLGIKIDNRLINTLL